jgi:L-asparaginase
MVVMNEEIHGAREVTKTDAQRLDAFQSRGGPLGVVDTDRIVFARRSEKRGGPLTEWDAATLPALPRVDVLLTYQGAPGDLIRAAVDNGAAGIVIATAAGGTSGTQLEGVRYATSKRVVVVSATRTSAGRVVPAGEPGRVVAAPGTLAAEDLAPIKARVLLMLALARHADPREIQRMFREY